MPPRSPEDGIITLFNIKNSKYVVTLTSNLYVPHYVRL